MFQRSTLKFNCVSKPDTYENLTFPDTLFFRKRCQEGIAMLIASSRSNPTGPELDYSVNLGTWGKGRYVRKTSIFYLNKYTVVIYTIIFFIAFRNFFPYWVCVKRPTVKRRQRMTVIWGILIPSSPILHLDHF